MEPSGISADEKRRPLWLRVLVLLGRGLATLLVVAWTLLGALVLPLVRPALAALAHLPVFSAMGRAIDRLPPYVVLALFAVPSMIIEPLKAVALYVMGIGHFWAGLALLVGAELMSLFVVERIYHAGHAPLMRIGWFKALMGWITGLSDLALGWARNTGIWRLGTRLRTRIAVLLRHMARA